MITWSLLYLACGVLVFVVSMVQAAAIPKDREHSEINDLGPPYMVNDREEAIVYAWLSIPFWPMYVLVFVLALLVGMGVYITRKMISSLEKRS